MKKAIGYLRVSTAEQADSGLGIADQQARIEAYCKLKRLELVRTVTDNGCSGGKPLGTRPGGKKMLAALRRREADSVIILKLDRGFRNAADCLATVEQWERRGITLHIVDLGGNAIDTASAAGKFMLTVLAGAAEMERNLARERTRAALDVKRQRGERISRYAPFGWTLDDQGGLQPDPVEQKALDLIRELHRQSKSLRQIAAVLTTEGILGRSGTPLSAKTIRAILKRPIRAA